MLSTHLLGDAGVSARGTALEIVHMAESVQSARGDPAGKLHVSPGQRRVKKDCQQRSSLWRGEGTASVVPSRGGCFEALALDELALQPGSLPSIPTGCQHLIWQRARQRALRHDWNETGNSTIPVRTTIVDENVNLLDDIIESSLSRTSERQVPPPVWSDTPRGSALIAETSRGSGMETCPRHTSDGLRVGCKQMCRCPWFERCFTQAEGFRPRELQGVDDAGVCSLYIPLVVLLLSIPSVLIGYMVLLDHWNNPRPRTDSEDSTTTVGVS